jgi:hypothetical protein
VGRLVSESRAGRIAVPQSVLSAAMNILRGTRATMGEGWQYMPIAGEQRLELTTSGGDCYVDHCCIICNGTTEMTCPVCKGARHFDRDVTSRGTTQTPFGNVPFADTYSVKAPCTHCGGTGHVHCTFCNDGIEHGGR